MLSSVVTGPHQTIVIGRVLAVHMDDRFILSLVACSRDTFELDRPKWAEWSTQNLK